MIRPVLVLIVIVGGLLIPAVGESTFAQMPGRGVHPDRAMEAVDARSLYLRQGTVDLRNEPSLLNAGYVFNEGNRTLIQLDGPITAERRAQLSNVGVILGDYLPMYAYLADLGQVRSDDLIDLGFVTWAGTYQDNWKICPRIASLKVFQTGQRQRLDAAAERRLVAHCYPDTQPTSVIDALQGIPSVGIRASDASGHLVEFDILESDLSRLRELSGIQFVEEAPEGAPRNVTTNWISQSNRTNEVPFWAVGLHGENQIVGLIDWDLDFEHCAFSDSVEIGPDHRKLLAYYGLGENPGFGWHGTHVGGILTGDELANTDRNLKGIAFESRLVFQHQAAVINSVNLYERLSIAHDDGARVHSNSWGSTFGSTYNAWARDIDRFSREREDDLVVFAIINGSVNSPPGTLLSPENAKNCLSVGASGETPNQDSHGSGASGPTDDGRQKPEVWVPGCGTNSAEVESGCGTNDLGCFTSWAAPAASGLAVLVRQYFMEGFYPSGRPLRQDAFVPSGALLKAALINSATDMVGFGTPDYFGPHEGWGRILLDDTLFLPRDRRRLIVEDVRNDVGLSTGETDTWFIDVPVVLSTLPDTEPLKITLVWTDVPATIGASFTPVNDLDLVVTNPDGLVFRGNFFDGRQSVFGGVPDVRNNAEQVHRLAPQSGRWRIDVIGSAVNVDLQGYALVVTGDLVTTAGACLAGDLTADGTVNGKDIAPFLSALMHGVTAGGACAGDFNGTGSVDLNDREAFVARLLSGSP